MSVYTVFREDYDEHNEGYSGMWNISFRTLDAAKHACEENVASIWSDISDLPLPGKWCWVEHPSRNNCWVLDDTETATVHTIMKTEIGTATKRISECPICGGELQATEETYLSEVVIDSEGNVLDYSDSKMDRTFRFYCENDHTDSQIVSWLADNVL